MALRLLRAVGVALALIALYTLSQRAMLAREGQTTPGTEIAMGVLSVFFLLGAWANERTYGPEANVRKDVLWGLGVGALVNFLVWL